MERQLTIIEAVAAACLSFIRRKHEYSVKEVLSHLNDKYRNHNVGQETVEKFLKAFYNRFNDMDFDIIESDGYYMSESKGFRKDKAETIANAIIIWLNTNTNKEAETKCKTAEK